ncbi:UDP-N-acetylmuramoyl-L-alanyl-D-glutamate--2,6-diaminopimelate ligase, partial [Cupriavidus basilensis]
MSQSLLPLEIAAQASDALAWLRLHAPAGAKLTGDTRRLTQGDVFFAYVLGNRRLSTDARPHIAQAIARGASAVVYEADGFAWPHGEAVPHLGVSGLHQLAGPIAAGWYDNAARDLAVTGITGTNGKTSCSQWLARLLQAAGLRCATIGTLGTGFPDALTATGFTTPDAVQLQDSLAELNGAGARAVAMEVSSHGLEQGRVAGTHFAVAVLTNLTQDHLDYHGTMAEYEAAKGRLFQWPGLRAAVINRDDGMGRRLLADPLAAAQVIEYGIDGAAAAGRQGGQWLRASGVRATAAGTAFHVDGSFGSADVSTPMIGEFNVSNLLAVLGAALANGIGWAAAIDALRGLKPVDGRMELFGGSHGGQDGPLAVVDYAHTPDAL